MSRTYREGKPLNKEEPKKANINFKQKKNKRIKYSLSLTDHAIIRFMERVLKIDFDFVLDAIVSEEIGALAKVYGDGAYPCIYNGESFKAIVKQGKIVTIKKKD